MNRLMCVLAMLASVPLFAAEPLPETVLERLIELKVNADFKRAPLQDVLHQLGESMQVEFIIDGDALKAAGWTKNMPVTMKLEGISPELAFRQILKQYDQPNERIVMCIDEDVKKILITTRSATEQSLRSIYQFPKSPAD